MRLHRFITHIDPAEPIIRIRDLEVVKQITRVFRLGAGDHILLSDGNHHEGHYRIRRVGNDFLDVEFIESVSNIREAAVHVVLYASILKRENFEFVSQKATEIGVGEIVPLLTERTVKLNLNLVRLQKIVKEAAEQSGRVVVPLVHPPISLKDAFARSRAHLANYFLLLKGASIPRVSGADLKGGSVGVFVGPEGGWTPDEEADAEKEKMYCIGLGKRILRAETAAIIASYLIVRSYEQRSS